MQILTDACVALLAAVGLWSLGRMALNCFLCGVKRAKVWTVTRIEGDANDLEPLVCKLLGSPHGMGVLLVDCGLTQKGRAHADELTKRYDDVRMCSWEQTGIWLKEAKEWTKQRNTIK